MEIGSSVVDFLDYPWNNWESMEKKQDWVEKHDHAMTKSSVFPTRISVLFRMEEEGEALVCLGRLPLGCEECWEINLSIKGWVWLAHDL